ncbi:MAG: DUF1553 domain-containing protein [Acidobacteriota bacterium]
MRKRISRLLLLICAPALLWLHSTSAQQAPQAAVDYARDIQPILAAHCIRCHGPERQMARLRLDSMDAIARVVTPGNSQDSRLIVRVSGEGGEPRMPLGAPPLSTEQIRSLRAWIDGSAGATVAAPPNASKAATHWAFRQPVLAKAPPVKNAAWVRNPVDQFILAEIEKQSLIVSPEAARTTLIRRLYLDITGLPPSLSEVDAFLADRRPDAYDHLVEKLLASPHYGERWGRWWLDAARYADTNGFEKDRPRSIWPYRDWVIRAFNNDLPFDQFTIEQLAGDLLPGATLDQKIATGFLRNSMLNEEGGVDPEQFRVEGVIDRVDAVGKAFLGLTVACAQCHNHKFDPIAQREYYQFYAFLNSDDEPELEVPGEGVTRKREEIRKEIAKIEDDLRAKTTDIRNRLDGWERALKSDSRQWVPLRDAEIFASFGVKFDRLEDGSFMARGDNSTSNNYRVAATTELKDISEIRLELLTDPNLPRGGPGRANDGSLYVTELSAEAAPRDPAIPATKIGFDAVRSDFARAGFPPSNVIDGDMKTHWSSDAGPGRRNQDRTLFFTLAKPVGFDGGTKLTFQISQKFDEAIDLAGGKPNIGRFRLSIRTGRLASTDSSVANAADGAPGIVSPRVERLLAIPPAERTAEQEREIFSAYRTQVKEWQDSNRRIDDLMKDWPYGPTTLAVSERPRSRETRIFRRGDWKRPDTLVTPGVPAVMHPMAKDAPRNRLGLARWIVDKQNPLTARVIVNRVWQQYFGQGLVLTAEDFGTRAAPPSHPGLLDYLAIEFQKSDWSFKHLHQLIVTSATYRQSSRIRPGDLERDPTNQYLARAPRLRVEAETVWDVALAVSGLLSPKIGGPSVYPPIPDGVLNLAYGRPLDWPVSKGEDRYRRGMYTFWKRSLPYPNLLVFDAPQGDLSCTRRIRSNTPLQALTTLNDTVFVQAAQGFGLRIWKEGGATDTSRMKYAFRVATGRSPSAIELKRLLEFLHEQRGNFTGRTAAAVYVSSADLNSLPPDVDLHQVAPWTMVARLLLNLDETITKE